MFKFYDRIRETSTSTGTGNFALSAYASNYLRFTDVFIANYRFPYAIVSNSEYEAGIGYLNGSNELVRETILSSTNFSMSLGNVTYTQVNFGSGNKDVFVPSPARLAPTLNANPADNYTEPQFLVYALNANSDGYEWQIMPLKGSGGNLTPIPNLTDKRILYSINGGEINTSDDLQFDPTLTTSLLTLTGDLYINGNLRAESKLFSIKHPCIENATLNHGSLEGPELGIYLRNTILIKNKYTYIIPPYFIKLVCMDDLNVFIQCSDGSSCSYKINHDSIEIKRRGIHFAPVKCSLFVVGKRKDIPFVLEEVHV